VQFAAAGHFEHVGVSGVVDAQGDVLQQFLFEALADLAAGDVLAFTTGQRRGVDHEVHGQGRLVDRDRLHAFEAVRVAQGDADVDLGDAGHQHDVAGLGHSAGVRSRPLKVRIWLTLPLPRFSSPYMTTTSWFGGCGRA
jgi:hypothetical protein